jgi:hypothetical protein
LIISFGWLIATIKSWVHLLEQAIEQKGEREENKK